VSSKSQEIITLQAQLTEARSTISKLRADFDIERASKLSGNAALTQERELMIRQRNDLILENEQIVKN
jgi:hypothetical protein